MINNLCNGLLRNNNPKSPIAYFEILTLREYTDYEGGTILDQIKTPEEFLTKDWDSVGEPFYRIYGKRHIDDLLSRPIILGDFKLINQVREFLFNITGEIPQIISY